MRLPTLGARMIHRDEAETHAKGARLHREAQELQRQHEDEGASSGKRA